MQVYKEIPIITAQPTAEEREEVEYRLYGITSVTERSSAAKWAEMAKDEINAARKENKIPILTGGSGMYIKILMEGIAEVPEISDEVREIVRQQVDKKGIEELHKILMQKDPETAKKLKPGDRQRIVRALEVIEETEVPISQWQKNKTKAFFKPDDFSLFAVSPEREKLYAHINKRFEIMLENGVMEEAQRMKELKLDPTLPARKAHGIPELINYLEGTMTLEEAAKQAKQNTRNYAKRQMTWLRHQFPEVNYITSYKEVLERR